MPFAPTGGGDDDALNRSDHGAKSQERDSSARSLALRVASLAACVVSAARRATCPFLTWSGIHPL
jgi:hypothetical protein